MIHGKNSDPKKKISPAVRSKLKRTPPEKLRVERAPKVEKRVDSDKSTGALVSGDAEKIIPLDDADFQGF